MPLPERPDTYPYPDPSHSPTYNDVDSASILSDSSTLRSMKLASFSDLKHHSEAGYGDGFASEKIETRRAPSLNVDSSYLAEKSLPLAPHEEATPIDRRQARPGRSRSPGQRHVLHSSRRFHSPNPRNTSRSPARPDKTQLEALAGSLGPDNVPHMAELDSIPCAGIRIPTGLFSGLLGWRLVVRLHSPWNTKGLAASDIRRAKNMPRVPKATLSHDGTASTMVERKGRRASWNALGAFSNGSRLSVEPSANHGRAMSEAANITPFTLPPPQSDYRRNHFASYSATSLPLTGLVKSYSSGSDVFEDGDWSVLPAPTRPWDSSSALVSGRRSPSPSHRESRRPLSSIFASSHHTYSPPPATQAQPHSVPTVSASAVVTNFLFDTSLGYNIISRETLYALGLSPVFVDALEASETSRSEPKTVSLRIQTIARPITFRLAPAGQPSRLGVQFLLESEVNVCMGDGGSGAVLWLDRADKRMSLSQVPKTVPLPKVSLQDRVKALFGLR